MSREGCRVERRVVRRRDRARGVVEVSVVGSCERDVVLAGVLEVLVLVVVVCIVDWREDHICRSASERSDGSSSSICRSSSIDNSGSGSISGGCSRDSSASFSVRNLFPELAIAASNVETRGDKPSYLFLQLHDLRLVLDVLRMRSDFKRYLRFHWHVLSSEPI